MEEERAGDSDRRYGSEGYSRGLEISLLKKNKLIAEGNWLLEGAVIAKVNQKQDGEARENGGCEDIFL